MKKITVIVCGIALSSVILTICKSQKNNQTIAATTEEGTLTLMMLDASVGFYNALTWK